MSEQQLDSRTLNRAELSRSLSASPQINIQNAFFNETKRTLPPKQRSLSLEQLIEIARLYLDEGVCNDFVETEAFKEGFRLLRKYRCIGIIGPPHSGKTTLALKIIKKIIQIRNDKPIRPVNISKPADWELVLNGFNREEAKENYILIIEDIFGSTFYDRSRAADWVSYIKFIQKLLDGGKIHVVFTCNTIVYNRHLPELFHTHSLLYLHEEKYKLSKEQRSKILSTKRRDRPRFHWFCMRDLCCENYQLLYKILRDRMELLYEHEVELYTVLLYILLNDGAITRDELDEHQFPSKIQQRLPQWKTIVNEIKKCCERLLGTYLQLTGNIYSFIEPCIRNIVLLTACEKCPEMIDVCPLRFAIERTNLGLDTNDEFKLRNKIQILVDRIKRCLEKGEHFENCTPLANGNILEVILKHLDNSQRKKLCRDLFLMGCDIGDRKCLGLILAYLEDGLTLCLGNPVPLVRVIKSEADSFEKCCLLLDSECPYKDICVEQRHILHYVAENWCERRIDELIRKYMFLVKLINVGDRTGNTPIHLAAKNGKTQGIISWLVNNGANVNSLNRSNKSPLQLALENLNEKRVAFVEELLDHDADVSYPCDDLGDMDSRSSLLHCINDCRHLPANVVEQLIGGRENINQQDKDGRTHLHHAVEKQDLSLAKILLDLGADVNIPEEIDRLTPLSLLCRYRGNYDDKMLELLIENKSDVNHRQKFNETPLHEAVEHGSVPIVRHLLENGAEPNSKSKNMKTPLHKVILAQKSAREELVNLLLEYNADECLKDSKGKTLKDLAKRRDVQLYKHLLRMELQKQFDRSCETTDIIENFRG